MFKLMYIERDGMARIFGQRTLRWLYLSLVFIFFFSTNRSARADDSSLPRVESIQVVGNRAVQEDAVLGLLSTKVGDPLDPNVIRRDIKIVFKSGFFQDVKVESVDKGNNTVALVFHVKEKPSIHDIRFDGFREVTEQNLKDKLQTKRYTIVDEAKLNQDVRMIEQSYVEKGYYLARASYVLEPQASGEVDVVFNVIEHNPVSVSHVHILGNVYLSDSEIKSGMFTREKRWGSWLTPPSGTFKDEFVNRDKEFLEYIYKDNGFAEASATSPQARLDASRQSVDVSFEVTEGERFHIGSVKISGDLIFSESYIKEKLSLKDGSWFRISQFQNDMRVLADLYGDEGYAFADPVPRVSTHRDTKTLDVEWVVTKGDKVYFRNIVVEGNSKTRDNVIRRNLKFAEGDRFSSTNLDKSKTAIERLGYFQEVQVLRQPDAKNKAMDVLIRVKEKMTGSLNASIYAQPGTSESRSINFGAQLSYSEANLMGRGWPSSIQAKIQTPGDPLQHAYELSAGVTEPSLDDGPWSLSLFGDYKLALGSDTQIAGEPIQETQKRSIGFRVGRELIEDLRLTFGYSYTVAANKNVSPFTSYFLETGTTEALTQSLSYDKTDNYLMPTSGFSFTADNLLGVKLINGSNQYGKLTGAMQVYIPVPITDDLRSNFRISIEPGYVYPLSNKPVPPWERFTLGNNLAMRAFNELPDVISPRIYIGAGGPASSNAIQSWPKGGNRRFYGTLEYYFPLIPEANLRLVAFEESGTVLDDNETFSFDKLKHDVGFGFRWQTPLAPFRFDFAWPVSKGQLGESKFVFNVGFDNQSSF